MNFWSTPLLDFLGWLSPVGRRCKWRCEVQKHDGKINELRVLFWSGRVVFGVLLLSSTVQPLIKKKVWISVALGTRWIFSKHQNCWTVSPPQKCCNCDGLSVSHFRAVALTSCLKGTRAPLPACFFFCRECSSHSVLKISQLFFLLLLQCCFFFYLHESNVEAETVFPLGEDLIPSHWFINRFSKAVVPCLCSYRAT